MPAKKLPMSLSIQSIYSNLRTNNVSKISKSHWYQMPPSNLTLSTVQLWQTLYTTNLYFYWRRGTIRNQRIYWSNRNNPLGFGTISVPLIKITTLEYRVRRVTRFFLENRVVLDALDSTHQGPFKTSSNAWNERREPLEPRLTFISSVVLGKLVSSRTELSPSRNVCSLYTISW